jgi:hypothetical protein
VDDARHLVTPEGRGLLDVLIAVDPDTDGIVALTDTSALHVERLVASTIRSWSRHRLRDVIATQRGEGPPMHPAAAALILLLLINGSVSPRTAVRRIRDKPTQQRFDASLARIVKAYTDAASPDNSAEDFRMWSGWHLTEARRRLPGQLILDDDGYLYIAPGREKDVETFLLADLRRSRVPPDRQLAAFDALVGAYRQALQQLTEMGSGFERVTVVEDLRGRLGRV